MYEQPKKKKTEHVKNQKKQRNIQNRGEEMKEKGRREVPHLQIILVVFTCERKKLIYELTIK
jgi:hypothetical protein